MADLSAVTKKVGPLPLWGWALAVVGAVIGFRVLSGKSAFASSTPSGGSVPLGSGGGTTGGGTTDGTGNGTSFDPSNLTNQITDLVSQVTGQADTIAGLGTSVSNTTSISGLQTQLMDAINKRAAGLAIQVDQNRRLGDYKTSYQAKHLTKSQYDSLVAKVAAEGKTNNAAITASNNTIADLQKQISGIGAA